MEKLKCLVLDHDRNARDLLRRYIEKTPTLQWTVAFSNPLEAILHLQTHQIDLIFMDFIMPELNGSEFLQMLNPRPLVIFTAMDSAHALQGFQLDAVDFLLKPLDFQYFFKAVSKAIRWFHLLKTPAYTESKRQENAHLILKSNRKLYRIATQEILYIEGMKEYAAIHLPNNNRLLFLHTLRHLEEMLPSRHFMRIHKSYIVAIDKTTALEGNFLYLGDVKIPVGESYKSRVMETIFT